MQTYEKENIIEKLIALVVNIDKKELLSKKDKKEIYQYLERELFTINEMKELVSFINYDKSEIINILYELIKLYLINKENMVFSKAMDLSKMAAHNNFDWQDNNACFNKIEEEVSELKKALKAGNLDNIEEELGDILFTLNSFSRLSKINIIKCLEAANDKFEKRFYKLKELIEHENLDFRNSSSKIKEEFWKKAKEELKSSK